jgi:hypothetical protein
MRLAEPVVLVGPLEGSFLASFGLGWGVTIGAGLASYPLDTIRRRMMMTSGGTVHYKSMFDAGSQIIAKEGTKSLFKGAGANILRGVAGAGVLSLYDKLQQVMFGKVYAGGGSIFYYLGSFEVLICMHRIWLSALTPPVQWFYGVSRSLIDLVLHPLSYFRILGDILLVPALDTKYKPTTQASQGSAPPEMLNDCDRARVNPETATTWYSNCWKVGIFYQNGRSEGGLGHDTSQGRFWFRQRHPRHD